MKARKLLLATALLASALAASGCLAGEDERAPDVVATLYPLAYFADRIAGPDLVVRELVPAGTEPHDWEPTPKDVRRAENARLFVYNGAGLEPWAHAIAERVSAAPGRAVVEAARGIDLHEGEHDHAHEEEDPDAHGHEAEGAVESAEEDAAMDPHIWLDPVRAQSIADNLLEGMLHIDPANATAHRERAETLKGDLVSLHADFRLGLDSCARREVLTTHAAFGYLADRYGFEQHAIAGLSPEAEPSPARLKDAVDLARRLNVTHVFFETLVSPRVAQVVASEIGAATLVLNPLEGLTPAERERGETYFTIMRANLANLRTAMGCS